VPVSDLFVYTKGLVNQAQAEMTAEYLGENGEWYNTDTGEFGGLFSDAFFVRYAYRLYDNTNVKLSPPILILPGYRLLNMLSVWIEPPDISADPWSFLFTPSMNEDRYKDKFFNMSSTARIGMFVPGIKYDLSSLVGYEGLIKGVDIFLSPYVGVSNVDNTNTVISFVRGDEFIISKRSSLVNSLTGDMMKRIREMSSFYLVKSLNIGESTGGDYVPFPEKTDIDTIYNIAGLVNREQLADDDFSIHKIGAKKSYAYNGRLHLADTGMTYFAGFDRSFFGWNEPAAKPPGGPIWYNGYPETELGGEFKWKAGDELVIETEITRGSYSGKVYSVYVFGKESVCVNSAMWSYPDAMAKRMTVYRRDSGDGRVYRVRVLELREHEFLNVAFYLEDGLRPVYIKSAGEEVVPVDFGRAFMVGSWNELAVSDVNNPLQFKIRNILTVGTGRIMAIGANVMNVSGRNYGVFPLYVFTTEGVYALRVGEGDVAYSTVTQPAYLEPPVSDVICQVPGGVVFAIARGLCVANGDRVDLLTGAVEELPAKLCFEIPSAIGDTGLYRNYGDEAFADYLNSMITPNTFC
jgi:hypothetical protein